MITATLSKKVLDTSSVGYQTPLPEDHVKPTIALEHEGAEGSPRAMVDVGVEEEGELEEMVTFPLSMRMVVGTSWVIVTQREEGEVAISAAVEEEVTMDQDWMVKKMLKGTMRDLVTSVVVEGGVDIMDLDLMIIMTMKVAIMRDLVTSVV